MTELCSLCLQQVDRLVKSHIIPKAFYEEFAQEELRGFSNMPYETVYKKGIYGNFLCNDCEHKFNQYDEPIIGFLKQGISQRALNQDSEMQLVVLEKMFEHKTVLHQFALSILWRASASKRDEYKSVVLGTYQEKIRMALLNNEFYCDLLEQTGMLFEEFRGGVTEFNHAFIPYRQHQKSKLFKDTFGNFHCHDFGFPYGELKIRLGGDPPKNGFMTFDNSFGDCHVNPAVIWTNNLSEKYQNWQFTKRPQSEEKMKIFSSQLFNTKNH